LSAFNAYDIRGVWGESLTPAIIYRIGFFLPTVMGCKEVAVGRDIRISSDVIFEHLSKGITDAGCSVLDLGVSTTPMVYFSTVHFKVGASVQITASHNPKIYNGLKISGRNAIPFGKDSGLLELKRLVDEVLPVVSQKKGTIQPIDGKTPYLAFLRNYRTDFSNLKLAIDCSNGVASLIVKELLGDGAIYINDWFDGNFPAHEPNPLDPTTCRQLQEQVLKNHCDVGIIYDGDADRVMFVDEKGSYVMADISMAILGMKLLAEGNGKVVADIRSSRSCLGYLKNLGGDVVLWKVGHVNAKAKLRETGAIFGGELAGHYYFRDFFNCDSAMLATLMILEVLAKKKKEGKAFSDLLTEIIRYHSSGEINFETNNKDQIIEDLYTVFGPASENIFDFDGYRIEYPSWWFSIRKSNTEPLLRLVLEASTEKELTEKLATITTFIHERL
jgi:phosphomannomutase